MTPEATRYFHGPMSVLLRFWPLPPTVQYFAAERLTRFKVPRYWQRVDALPRTPTQRVAKHRLPDGHPPDEVDLG